MPRKMLGPEDAGVVAVAAEDAAPWEALATEDAGAGYRPHEPSEQDQRDLEALGTDICHRLPHTKENPLPAVHGLLRRPGATAPRQGQYSSCLQRCWRGSVPTGVTMYSCQEVNLYLGMVHWQVWRGDAWCPWEEQPRSAMPLALCGGMSVTLGPYGALGLFGDVALLAQREVCAGEVVEPDCADVSDIPTPPTPPPFL